MQMVDLKTLIVNLAKESGMTYVFVEDIYKLLRFIYQELKVAQKLDCYRISYDIGFGEIDRVVWRHQSIFDIDPEKEVIYLRVPAQTLAAKCEVDETIQAIIRAFVARNIA